MTCSCAHHPLSALAAASSLWPPHGAWSLETAAEKGVRLAEDCVLLAQKDDDQQQARLRKLVRVEHDLATLSAEEWDRRARKALKAIGKLASTKPAMARTVLRIIARRFDGLEESLQPLYEDKIGIAYGIGRDGVAADLKQSVTFNTVDQQAKGWLADHHLYWVGKAYPDQFSGRIAGIVDEHVVQQGLSYKDAAKVLQTQLGPELVGEKPLSYWEVVANAAAVRSRSFGAVESFVQGGISVVEILNPEDEATCPTCRHLSGQRFEIAQVVGQRNAMMEAGSPEEAKQVAPWRPPADVVGKGAAELASQGTVLPPYHGRCRCTANAWVEGASEYTPSYPPAPVLPPTASVPRPVIPGSKLEMASPVQESTVEQVHEAFRNTPDHVRRRLKAAKVEYVVGEKVVDHAPELASQRPRNFFPGTTFEHVQAVFYDNKVICADKWKDFTTGQWIGDRPVERVVHHEIGHAFDLSRKNPLSARKPFMKAYASDISAMKKEKRAQLDYFLSGDGGNEETFAEAYNIVVSGKSSMDAPREQAFRETFPGVLAHVQSIVYPKGR